MKSKMELPVDAKLGMPPVSSRRRPTATESCFWLLAIILLCRLGWYSKIRYAVEYGVGYSQVTMDSEPHDCDWLAPPIGSKGCHYEMRKRTVRTALDASGKSIISYDDGATWQLNGASGPTKTEVFLSWQKFVGDE